MNPKKSQKIDEEKEFQELVNGIENRYELDGYSNGEFNGWDADAWQSQFDY